MAERYTRLFALPADLYTEGAPLLVAAGALLKDTVTGKVLAQLKFTSLCEKTIKAVKVRVTPFDTVGRPLGEAVPFTYLDLAVTRGNDFGQKTPIPLAESEARSFAVTVEEVAFADNSLWAPPAGAVWEPLPAPQTVDAMLQDHELVKQYALKYGQNHTLWPQRAKNLWRCSCGALNHATEKSCHRCSWTIEDLDIDIEALKTEAAARLEQERIAEQKAVEEARQAKEKAAEEARRAAEQAAIAAAAKQKARKKGITIFAVVAGVIAAAAAAWVFVLQPTLLYRQVMADMESGEYDAAITALETRPDTDEKAQIHLAYAKAAKALAGRDLDAAEAELDKFADYEPLQEQHAQMSAAHDQMLFDNFFDAIQVGGSNAKKYWDRSQTTGGFTKEQCYQVAQWIVSEGHADSKDKAEGYHSWVDTLLAGQEQAAEAAALLEQNDLQYAEKVIAASDTAADIDEGSYQALKEVLSKYNSEQAQQLNAEWDALWEREQKYQAAYAILTSQESNADYRSAKQTFEELGDYKDAKICAEDAQNLIGLAKFLGIYRKIEATNTSYTANGSVYNQYTFTENDVYKPFASIYYSFSEHCLSYVSSLESVPTIKELAALNEGDELTADGNTIRKRTPFYGTDEVPWNEWKGNLSGNYIYITDSTDFNIIDNPIKHKIYKYTLQKAG